MPIQSLLMRCFGITVDQQEDQRMVDYELARGDVITGASAQSILPGSSASEREALMIEARSLVGIHSCTEWDALPAGCLGPAPSIRISSKQSVLDLLPPKTEKSVKVAAYQPVYAAGQETEDREQLLKDAKMLARSHGMRLKVSFNEQVRVKTFARNSTL